MEFHQETGHSAAGTAAPILNGGLGVPDLTVGLAFAAPNQLYVLDEQRLLTPRQWDILRLELRPFF